MATGYRFIKGLVFALFLIAFMQDESDADVVKTAKEAIDNIFGFILATNEAFQELITQEAKATDTFSEVESNRKAQSLILYQGDIMLDPDMYNLIKYSKNKKTKRNAVRSRSRIWISRVIPYKIPYNMEHIRTNLMIAINEIQQKTCLTFVPYTGQKNYIYFHGSRGCSSRIGKMYFQTGGQGISIGNNCNHPGIILHELLHALGFWHEQSRPDRDKYVRINYENIQADARDQFDKYDWETIDDLGKDYDFESIMHYSRMAFSSNNKPTIQAIHDPNMRLGNPANRLSVKDAIEINALYDCSTQQHGWSRWSSFTPCNDQCVKTRQRYCYHPKNDFSHCPGANIYGIQKQQAVCLQCPEPINGHWGNWGPWTACSATCDDGAKKRTRLCDNPAPAHGGKACPGNAQEEVLCMVKRCILDADDTDFESNRMGIWTNSRHDDFDWTLIKGFTQTMDTGPFSDHTSGKGYYLYTESSAPRVKRDTAKLVTSWRPFVYGGQCIKFAYHMYGKTIGRLGLLIELEGLNTKYYIFYKTGSQGKGWKRAMGNIDPPKSVRYRLTFEAVLGDTGYSDFAIDDVYIDPGLCNCQDDYIRCQQWTASGECQKNANWMTKHCKRSCQKCLTVIPTTTLSELKTTQITTTNCIDSNPVQCPLWADKGECTSNPIWMNKNCPKSCGICGCNDSDPIQCPLWAAKGICKTNPDYMLVNCIKSCNVCRCHDNELSCNIWKSKGECTKNPIYMRSSCKKSCGVCKE